jgi:hypothetical protein
MSLKSILRAISPVAPLLAKILPLPGAGIAGDLIASALGVRNDPASIETALNSDPDALLKIKEIELKNQGRLQEMAMLSETNRLVAVNQTMRGEQKSEHWPQWFWRPLWGMVSALAFLVLVIFVCMLAWKAINAGDAAAINMIPQLIGSFAALFGIPMTILGVASWHRGKEKRAIAGDVPGGGILASLLKKIP